MVVVVLVVKLLAKALVYKLKLFPVDISSITGLRCADECEGLDSVALMFGDSRHGMVQLVLLYKKL